MPKKASEVGLPRKASEPKLPMIAYVIDEKKLGLRRGLNRKGSKIFSEYND